jgi:hypothetical protein
MHVKSLPPTSDSAKFHSLRVYYQCQKWMSETVDIDPTDWEWEIKRGKLCPILMEHLIHDIHHIRLNIEDHASYTHIVWCHNFVCNCI